MAELEGLQNVLQGLRSRIDEIEGATLKGLIRGAIVIIRGTEETPPLTPIDTGNLRASRFIVTSRGGAQMGRSPSFEGEDATRMASDHSQVTARQSAEAQASRGPAVVLGYTAHYATVVHEKVGANFQRPGAGAKFLEASIKRNEGEVTRLIQEEAKGG